MGPISGDFLEMLPPLMDEEYSTCPRDHLEGTMRNFAELASELSVKRTAAVNASFTGNMCRKVRGDGPW
jgi:hypothetical protein